MYPGAWGWRGQVKPILCSDRYNQSASAKKLIALFTVARMCSAVSVTTFSHSLEPVSDNAPNSSHRPCYNSIRAFDPDKIAIKVSRTAPYPRFMRASAPTRLRGGLCRLIAEEPKMDAKIEKGPAQCTAFKASSTML